MLDFLGYRSEVLSAYTTLMNDRPGSRNAAYARFNGARLSSKIEGPSEKLLEQAKQGRAELAKLGLSAREIGKLDKTLASMEADVEAALLDILQGYLSRGVRRSEPSAYLLYAQYLASEGSFPEAIIMIRQGASLSEQFGWHLPRLWILKAAWHSELGQEGEAAATWKRIDDLLEAHDDVSRETSIESIAS